MRKVRAMGKTARHLLASQGYCELGMFQEAWDELEELPPLDRARGEVLAMRVAILNLMSNYKMASEIARDAVKKYPTASELYFSGAYAMRRSESVEAAFGFLTSSSASMMGEPEYWFKLGCYNAQMGNFNDALDCVSVAVEMDPDLEKRAMSDPDLEELREELVGELV